MKTKRQRRDLAKDLASKYRSIHRGLQTSSDHALSLFLTTAIDVAILLEEYAADSRERAFGRAEGDAAGYQRGLEDAATACARARSEEWSPDVEAPEQAVKSFNRGVDVCTESVRALGHRNTQRKGP